MDKLVSIIIVNYNGKEYLKSCIESIFDANNIKYSYEIIIADNNSSDGSVEFIQKEFSNYLDVIKFLQLDKNYGPARARNEAAKIAGGKYLGFLDNDTKVDKNWLNTAVDLFESDNKIGCLQCKLLLMDQPDKFDYAGEYIGQSGFLVQRAGYMEVDKGQYDQNVEILAAKSAGMFIRKDVFNKIEGFDEDYFIYMEETDLGWRSWLIGYKTIFCYQSIVFHKFSTSSKILSKGKHNYNVRFHGTKNYILTLLKNLSFLNMAIILPKNIFCWIGLSSFFLIKGDIQTAGHILSGLSWNVANMPGIFKKRKKIQGMRVISDKELFRSVMKKQSIIIKIKQFVFARKKLI